MIYKCVIVEMLFGGFKGGFCIDLCVWSEEEFECIICCFVYELCKCDLIYLVQNVFVLDMGIGECEMVWIVDVYCCMNIIDIDGFVCVIGKLIYEGGINGCIEVMGCGVQYVLQEFFWYEEDVVDVGMIGMFEGKCIIV